MSTREEKLISEAKTGNTEAFSELVKIHQKRIYYMVFRYLKAHEAAEEAVQKTFIDAWKYLKNFEGRSSFLTWLMRIAINNSKKELLLSKREPQSNIDNLEIAEQPTILENLSELERNTLLASEIRKLTEKQQTILQLRVYENLSFRQIGEVLNCSESTAKSHFHHIKNQLKESILKITSETKKAEEDDS